MLNKKKVLELLIIKARREGREYAKAESENNKYKQALAQGAFTALLDLAFELDSSSAEKVTKAYYEGEASFKKIG